MASPKSKVERRVLSAVRAITGIDPEVSAALKRSEGFRGDPYNDHLGFPTIGYGAKLPLSRAESEVVMLMRAGVKVERLDDALATRGIDYGALPVPARRTLVRMSYQLGVGGVMKFKRMVAAVKDGRWRTAYAEALDSKWGKRDTAKRARRVAKGFLDSA